MSIRHFASVGVLAVGLVANVAAQKATELSKVGLSPILILSDEFCGYELKEGNIWLGREKYPLGREICPAIEDMSTRLFEKSTVAKSPADQAGGRHLILTPRMVTADANRPMSFGKKKELVLLVEWSAVLSSRPEATLWAKTVQGEALGKQGNAFTSGKHRKRLIADAINDLMAKSELALREAASQSLLAIGQ